MPGGSKEVALVKCPYCEVTIEVARANYAYAVSQVATHLDGCLTRPQAERESVMERAGHAVRRALKQRDGS